MKISTILLASFLVLFGLAGLGVPLGVVVPIVALVAGIFLLVDK